MPDETPLNPEREQTDESLRAEREKADRALDEDGSSVDDTADAVISRARIRADALLAAARAKTDRRTVVEAGAPPAHLEKERVREDQILQSERAHADETLREEREEHVALLAHEREATDKDLSSERALSDDALATRDEFLAVVSHDLRNMLSGMVGFAGLIADALPRPNHVDDVLMFTHRIQRSATRMNRLIGDLIDVASIEAGRLAVTREVGDPGAIVLEAVDNFQERAAAKRISLSSEVPPALLSMFDPARILQVLTNLLSNAIKFTPAGGTVAVHLEHHGDELRFAVRDTGVGIPASKLEEVFGRFVQVDEDTRGVGLGLYISKCIVLGHGGRIWAESRIGESTTVSFTLPAHSG
jgi:signal transduction histidine kinase